MTWFKSRHHLMLGLDVSPSSVKLLEIAHGHSKPCIERLGYERLPAHSIESGTIKDVDAVTACIKKCVSQINTLNPLVILAVPDSLVISKTIQFVDNLSDRELEELILIEANKYMVDSPNEISVDFSVLGPSKHLLNMLDVKLIACRKDNVDQRVEAITRAGLQATIVETESSAIERMMPLLIATLPAEQHHETIAVIRLNSRLIQLFIISHGQMIYTREDMFNDKQAALVKDHRTVLIEETMSLPIRRSTSVDNELEAVQPAVSAILWQIKRSLQFFFSLHPSESMAHLFLMGELASLENLAYLIQEITGISTSVANPFKYLVCANSLHLNKLAHLAPSFVVACGLALRRHV